VRWENSLTFSVTFCQKLSKLVHVRRMSVL